jgi:protein TonB
MDKTLLLLSALMAPAVHAAVTIHADVLFSHLTPDAKTVPWQRVNQHTPKYPLELAQNGIRGCGVFKVWVDADGETDEVELVSAVPKKGLHRPVIKILKGWKWQPNPDAAQSGDVKTAKEQPMLVRLDFCMGGKTIEEAAANCQVQAQYACQE